MDHRIVQWSDGLSQAGKWLVLEWDRIQAMPHGLLGAAWTGIEALSAWMIGNIFVYIGMVAAAVALVTLRLLRMKL